MSKELIRNIWAVGRNYADHAKELGNALPKEPLFFLKAGSSVQTGPELLLSSQLGEIHHEVELAFKLDQNLRPTHFAIALDLTDRTAQTKAKAEGLPWTRAKSFKGACVLGEWKAFNETADFYSQEIELKINGEVRQKATLEQMIFKHNELITALDKNFPIVAGDILLTGTPSGVGPLKAGDQIECRIGSALTASWLVKVQA